MKKLQKEYVKKLPAQDKDGVIKYTNDDEVSYSLPDMKYAGLGSIHFTLWKTYEV